MAYGNLNVDTVTTSTTGGVLGAGNASMLKNRIINGGMVIDQRNAGASVILGAVNPQYGLDRWSFQIAQASKLSFQQNAGSVTPPVGFTNYLGITSLSAYSSLSTDYFMVHQGIEGYNTADLMFGTANAKTVTLSFWVYSSLTGTFGGSLLNNAGNRSYPYTYTISSANTWTQISVTIAGDITGTWVGASNSTGISVYFDLGCGSANRGTAGTWASSAYYGATGTVSVVGTSGATFYITGVQLEVGSSATGFEYRQYGQELALCQRYYQVTAGATGYATSALAVQLCTPLMTRMRAAPTATPTAAIIVTDGANNYTQSSASITFAYFSSGTGGFVQVPNFTGLTTFRPAILNNYATGGGDVALSAEL